MAEGSDAGASGIVRRCPNCDYGTMQFDMGVDLECPECSGERLLSPTQAAAVRRDREERCKTSLDDGEAIVQMRQGETVAEFIGHIDEYSYADRDDDGMLSLEMHVADMEVEDG